MPTLRDIVTSHPLFTKSRLYSLYSDFRKLKEVNPEGYEANLIAWNSLIEDFFDKSALSHSFVLETDGLVDQLLLAEYGKPLALDLVLEESIKAGNLIPYQVFKNYPHSIYTKKWVRPLVNWAVNKFIIDLSYKVGDKKHNLKSDKFISKKSLEDFSKRLSTESTDGSKILFTKDQFKTLYGLKSDLDLEIALLYLERDVGKIKTKGDIIKLSIEDITDEDLGIIQIKSTIETLNLKNDELTEKINLTTKRLKESLKTKNKDLSKNLLISKKIAEKSLNKQLTSLNQLESALYKIDESSTNLQLLSALEKGTAVLKGLNNQAGGVEKIEKIMDEFDSEKAKANEISDELYRLDDNNVDEDEIEEELENILAEQQKDQSKAEDGEAEADISQKLEDLKLAPTDIKETPAKEELVLN